MDLDFSDEQLERYARHIMLPEVGGVGQARLRQARVLVVGAGGLGSPLRSKCELMGLERQEWLMST